MGEVIVVTSGKGGVGKSTTTANLGIGLVKMGRKVILVDTDIGLRNLDVLLGLENSINYDIVDVIEKKCKLQKAVVQDPEFENLYLLPAAQTKDKDSITPDQVKKLINDIRKEFDYIIIDCPAGIERGFKNAIAAADRAIMVTTPEIFAVRDADRVLGLLKDHNISDVKLIVNKIRPNMVKRGDMMSPEDVADILKIELAGAIPDDEDIITASNNGRPLAGDGSLCGMAYMDICKRILGENVPFMDILNDNRQEQNEEKEEVVSEITDEVNISQNEQDTETEPEKENTEPVTETVQKRSFISMMFGWLIPKKATQSTASDN